MPSHRPASLKARGNSDPSATAVSRSLLCLGSQASLRHTSPPPPPHLLDRSLDATYYNPASLHLLDVDPHPDSLARLNLPTALTHLAFTWSAPEPPSDSLNPPPPLTPMLLNLPLTLTQLLLPGRRLSPVEVRLLGQIPSLVDLEVLCLDLSHLPSPAEEADGGSAAATSTRLPAIVLPCLKKLVVHAYFNLSAPLTSHFPCLAWLHMGRPNQVGGGG